jgi:hypothetical protein
VAGIFSKHRFKVYNQAQHPLVHSLADFGYSNEALPGVSNVETALNYILAVLYPQTKTAVANVAALPALGNTLNDFRVVDDDGDGKAAGYRWEQREGESSASWHKIYDLDWGADSILSSFYEKTQDIYVHKYGFDDLDASGALVAGTLAGQTIFGGRTASKNLTLKANSGDGTGAQTGYVQFGDNVRPIANNTLDFGTSSNKFKDGYFAGTLTVGTASLSSGNLSDSSGTLNFGSTALVTTGSISGAAGIFTGALSLSEIATPASPSAGVRKLYFKSDGFLYRLNSSGVESLVGITLASTHDNRLIRSDGTGATGIQESGITVDDSDQITGVVAITSGNLELSGNTLISTDTNGAINLTPNGSGAVVLANHTVSNLTSGKLPKVGTAGLITSSNVGFASDSFTGVVSAAIGNITVTGNTISTTNTNGDLLVAPNGTGGVSFSGLLFPSADNAKDLGKTAARFRTLYLGTSIGDGTNTISIATLLSFRAALSGASSGMTLFYDGTTWNASIPDSEITHGTLSGLSSDDHTQYALLAGRGTGQSLVGGTASGNDLSLDSTSDSTKGAVKFKSTASPFADAAFSVTWSGTDLGSSSFRWNNFYMAGEAKGLRIENFAVGSLPAFSAQKIGRLYWTTDTTKLYADTGSAVIAVSATRSITDTSWDGSTVTKSVTITGMADVRNAIWQLKDNTNNYEVIYCAITHTGAANVTITVGTALPAGTYRLIGIE